MQKCLARAKISRRAVGREADAGPGVVLRALGRGGARRLLRRPRRVAGHLGRPRRRRARARRRRPGRAASARSIRGLDPLTGERLRRHPKERTITIERIDPHAGERRHRAEEALAGRGLRPRLQRAQERQPAARARRRGDAPGRSARRTSQPGRRRSGTSRTRRASPAAARTASSVSTAAASSLPRTSTARAARRTRTCTRT